MQDVEFIYSNNNYKVAFCRKLTNYNELNKIASEITIPDFKSTKRKNEWLTTHFLLKKICKRTVTYSYNKLKKPVLNNENENISITHSAKYAAVIVGKRKKVGIDIEEISSRIHKIAHKFLNETENKYVSLSDNKTVMLYVIWCAKESIYKYSDSYLDFPSQIIINKFKPSAKIINAQIFNNKRIQNVKLHCKINKEYVLVWIAQ
ncbi:MAG: hypothetical protein COS14_07650 [Bacteroidetes bacterium CG02_land_8_20_14_3_00_31_25]|nr:MAG: hypothetical protein COS14_07650 [Bacteroidetes bacterium CG02_land_8_20_14_3_00_31_25]PIX34146.1 MAG: hypothetical protein COZ59_08325 [Bacteroidetes bacterium CG_4_8_14_3_um_filter_31_14]